MQQFNNTNNQDERFKNELSNYGSKRQTSSSPNIVTRKRKEADIVLNLAEFEENETDDFDFEIKEEKIFNNETSFADFKAIPSNASKVNKRTLNKNISFSYWNRAEWADLFTLNYELMLVKFFFFFFSKYFQSHKIEISKQSARVYS